MSIVSNSFTNSGIAETINGGILTIASTSWSNDAAGTIRALNGSVLNFQGSYTNSGALTLADSTLNLQGTFTVGALGLSGFNRSGGECGQHPGRSR